LGIGSHELSSFFAASFSQSGARFREDRGEETERTPRERCNVGAGVLFLNPGVYSSGGLKIENK
jgi:hypothetical protein